MSIPRERRLDHEWECLSGLAVMLPDRLLSLQRVHEDTFLIFTGKMPALDAQPGDDWKAVLREEHRITFTFPRYYPAMPSEAFLDRPVFHPNVDPENGFVCLWSKHRIADTAADALVRLAAVLAWRLFNAEAPHIMQPQALSWYNSSAEVRARLPLAGGPWAKLDAFAEASPHFRRRRLS